MQTRIPASSPLFNYSPCRACDGGWALASSVDTTNSTNNAIGSAWSPSSSGSLLLNFTGTGISFDTTLADWTTELSINGTECDTLHPRDLPLATHSVELVFTPGNATLLPIFNGATVDIGTLAGASSTNTTIDDTEWRSGKVVLSSGWNMLEKDQSNWINDMQMEEERTRAGMYWNESVSWTQEAGANATVLFSGSAVWVYGISGGEAGAYSVLIDNSPFGTYNATAGPRSYGALLFTTSSLTDGNHSITLVNLEQGRRLSFDRLDYMSGLLGAVPTSTPPTDSVPIPVASHSPKKGGLIGAQIAGIVVGSVFGLLGLALSALAVWFWLTRRKMSLDKRQPHAEPSFRSHDRSFWRWSGTTGASAPQCPQPSEQNEPPRPFVPLREKPSIPHLGAAIQREDTATPPPPPTPSREKPIGVSFLKLSRSPKKASVPLAVSAPLPPMPQWRPNLDPGEAGRPRDARGAVMSDTISPLSTIRDSYLPRLGLSKLIKKHHSADTEVEGGDAPAGECAVRGGQNGDEASRLPSMDGARHRILDRLMGEARPLSGDSGLSVYSKPP